MIKPRKRFGQHFLEPAWVRKLLDIIAPGPHDIFLEIGPGLGAVTLPLAQVADRIVAVEIDRDLAGRLARSAPGNVRVVTDDFLKADLHALLGDRRAAASPVRVVGNLPYNISSPVLFRLLSMADAGRFFRDATVMLQREVADRAVAQPGSGDYGVLSILTQFHARTVRSLLLPPGAFRPPPRIDSAVVHLTFTPPAVPVIDGALFERMVRAMFMHRRKTVANALRSFAANLGQGSVEALAKAGIEPRRRPETLQLAEIARLADVFASGSGPDVL